MFSRFILSLVAAIVLASSAAWADKRVALVIGKTLIDLALHRRSNRAG